MPNRTDELDEDTKATPDAPEAAPTDEELERNAEEALPADGEELPSSGLLSFYDRLREKVSAGSRAAAAASPKAPSGRSCWSPTSSCCWSASPSTRTCRRRRAC